MVQITERDEAMVQWLDVVRLAGVEAVRWALGAFVGAGQPLSLWRAQLWVARMTAIGWCSRALRSTRWLRPCASYAGSSAKAQRRRSLNGGS